MTVISESEPEVAAAFSAIVSFSHRTQGNCAYDFLVRFAFDLFQYLIDRGRVDLFVFTIEFKAKAIEEGSEFLDGPGLQVYRAPYK